MPTPVLLGELRDLRRLARTRTWWLDGAMGAMRARRVLAERGDTTANRQE